MSSKAHLINTVIVEDNPADRKLLENLFSTSKLRWNFFFLGDSLEALKLFSKQGKYSDQPDPDLIILDLNLPKMDGWELLRRLKISHRLRDTPVIILTTSESPEDQEKAREFGVSFFTKPSNFSELSTLAERIEWLWMNRFAEKDS